MVGLFDERGDWDCGGGEMSSLTPTISFPDVQHPPIKNEYKFQEFIKTFFNEKFSTDTFEIVGVRGEKQNGIDVISHKNKIAIQCKCVDIRRHDPIVKRDLIKKIKNDFTAFKAFNKKLNNHYVKYYIASTYKNSYDIQQLCNNLTNENITVLYYSWDRILEETSQESRNLFIDSDKDLLAEYYGSSDINYVESEFHVDDSVSSIDQLHEFLKTCTKVLKFIYPKMLSKCKVLYKNESDFSYSNFALYITDKETYESLKSISYNESNKQYIIPEKINNTTTDSKNKIRFIFETLYNNLIFKVHISNNEFFEVNCNKLFDVNNFLFLYEACNINNLAKQLVVHPDDSTELLLEKSFYQFRIHAYKESFKTLQLAVNKVTSDENFLFLLNFNLHQLSKTTEFKYYSSWKITNDIIKVENINIQDQYSALSSLNKLLFKNYSNNNYYNQPLGTISDLSRKIRYSLENSIKYSGTNSNQYVNDLIFAFAQFDYSLTRNNVFFEGFAEFDTIVDQFTEGVLASYSITSNRHSHLINLQEYVLVRILLYCRFDSLKHLCYVYKISKIKYTEFNKKDAGIITIICNLFDNYNQVLDENSSDGINYSEFFEKYIELMKKSVFLASRLELSKSQCKTISTILLKFLENIDFINNELGRQIVSFFTLHSKLLDSSKYKRLSRAVLINKALHSESIFEFIIEALNKKGINLNSQDSKKLLNCFFGPCQICNDNHNIEILLSNFSILCVEEQKRLSHRYSANHKELSFNEHFLALYHDVFNDLESFVSKAITTIENDIKTPKKNFLFFDIRADRRKSIDWFIWICYKYNISLNDAKFIFIRDFDPYYYWLSDMDGFDYSQFEPIWICEFSSGMHSGYYKRIKSCPNALNAIKLYLENNTDLMVEHVYMKILKID